MYSDTCFEARWARRSSAVSWALSRPIESQSLVGGQLQAFEFCLGVGCVLKYLCA